MEKIICPVCGQETEPIPVHGHYQCAKCGTNIAPCCDGADIDFDE